MLKWRPWLYGLAWGFISSGAGSVVSAVGLWGAKQAGMDVPTLNFKAMGIIFVSGGIFATCNALMKSPLPALSTGDTIVFTKPQDPKPPADGMKP